MAVLRAGLIVLLVLVLALIVMPLQGLIVRRGGPAPAWVLRLACRALLACMGVRVQVRGHVRSTPRLIVANHVSWLDILAVASIEPVCFVAKSEVASWPLVSGLAALHGTIFIDRARRRLIPPANAVMARHLGAGRSVLLFPEGTTHDGAVLGRFHTAHLGCLRDRMTADPQLPACAVQPLAVFYSDPVAAWVGDATLVPHLWAVLRGPRLSCTLAYGETTLAERGHDRKALGLLLRHEIERTLATLAPAPARPDARGPVPKAANATAAFG